MSFPCETIIRPAQPALSVRTRASVDELPGIIGGVYAQILAYVAEQGQAAPVEAFVGYYNLDMQDLDLEIGFTVTQAIPGREQIQASEIPAGEYAACLYTGPYEAMEPAYSALQEHIAGMGRQASGIAYEFYLNGPDQAPPELYQTRILFPLVD